jgi:hypothetical protein
MGATVATAVSLVDDAALSGGDRARRRALMSTGASGYTGVDEAERRKQIRRTALWLGLIALVFYVGFIAMSVIRGSR